MSEKAMMGLLAFLAGAAGGTAAVVLMVRFNVPVPGLTSGSPARS